MRGRLRKKMEKRAGPSRAFGITELGRLIGLAERLQPAIRPTKCNACGFEWYALRRDGSFDRRPIERCEKCP